MHRLFLSSICAAIACLPPIAMIPDAQAAEPPVFAQVKPTRSTSERIARRFIRQIEAKNLQALSNLLSENVVLEQPFQLPERPNRFEGKQSLQVFFEGINQTFSTIRFENLRTIVSADGRTVTIEGQGNFVIAANGLPYQNVYITVLQIEDGKITGIREYFNPLIIAQAFNIDLTQGR
jgi:uncharacterized protein